MAESTLALVPRAEPSTTIKRKIDCLYDTTAADYEKADTRIGEIDDQIAHLQQVIANKRNLVKKANATIEDDRNLVNELNRERRLLVAKKNNAKKQRTQAEPIMKYTVDRDFANSIQEFRQSVAEDLSYRACEFKARACLNHGEFISSEGLYLCKAHYVKSLKQ